jgi:hypothetical protein
MYREVWLIKSKLPVITESCWPPSYNPKQHLYSGWPVRCRYQSSDQVSRRLFDSYAASHLMAHAMSLRQASIASGKESSGGGKNEST